MNLLTNNFSNTSVINASESEANLGLGDELTLIIAYISLINIIIGVTGNVISFIVFVTCQELRKMSHIVYLTYCSVMNVLSLFNWNLNHFLTPIYGIAIESIDLASCRIFSFLQYFSLESSAYLLSFMCIDRFVSVVSVPGSFASRLPFSTARSAHLWSLLIMIILFGIHSHLLILNGYFDPPQLINLTINENFSISVLYQNPDFHCYSYSPTFTMFPFWDSVHLYLFTFIPFVIMLTFNVLLIVKTLLPHNNSSLKTSKSDETNRERRRLTRSILALTISFFLMTVPAAVAFGYFGEVYQGSPLEFFFNFLDNLSFMHQSFLFINCLITNRVFRLVIVRFFKRLVKFLLFCHRKSNAIRSLDSTVI